MNQHFLSNSEYKKYLQNNSKNIIQTNSNKAFIKLGVNPYNNNSYIDNKIKAYYNPYIYQSSYDSTQLGRCIPFSQMKINYLTNKQLQHRMISPSIKIDNFNI
jgi:hypothetical protein